MKRFTFDEVTDFSDFFSGDNQEVTDAIVDGIREAYNNGSEEAELFELGFTEEDDFFEVCLPTSEWEQALSKCLEKYENVERYDDVIDTYTLLEKVKEL